MRGRYLQPKNAWEFAWNSAVDSCEKARREGEVETPSDPYEAAWSASEAERRKVGVPQQEWCYESCRRHTKRELEDRKRLEEWASRYWPEEEENSKKRARKMGGFIL
jgi:hypothetical protein